MAGHGANPYNQRAGSYMAQDSGVVRKSVRRSRVSSAETFALLLLFIIAPICGLIGIAFSKAFLWVFVGVMALTLAVMWLLRCFESRARAALSVVLLLLSAAVLVAVIDLSPKDESFSVYGGDTVSAGGLFTQPSVQTNNPAFVGLSNPSPTNPIQTSPTDAPPSQSDPQGDQQAVNPIVAAPTPGGGSINSAAQAVLENYLKMWQAKNYEDLVQYTTPSWRASQQQPYMQLYWMHSGWLLSSWSISSNATNPAADSITFNVICEINKANAARTPVTRQYSAITFNIDGSWYVDPDSMRTGLDITQAQAVDAGTGESVPTEPTVSPSTRLYYNSDGGSFYHAKNNCPDIAEKYYKYMKEFTYSLINEAPYSKLKRCPTCKPPER